MIQLQHIGALAVLAALLSGASCELLPGVSVGGGGGGGTFGVFKSFDSGKTWESRVFVRQGKKAPETIAGANVTTFRFDPNNPEKVYIGTSNAGLWVTENGSESWRQLYPDVSIQDVVLDPKNNIIYFATANSIYKSIDDGKTWPVLYLETRKGVAITALALNDKNALYAGSSNGELLFSSDFGTSWKVVRRFENHIRRVSIRPGNVNELFVATADRGIWRSSDSGATWNDILIPLEKEYKNIRAFRDVVFDPNSQRIAYAARFGIFLSTDNGATWGRPLTLLTAPDTVDIGNLAVSPRDPNILFYTVGRTLYRTFSAGDRWETIALPGTGRPTALVAHPRDRGVLYLGESR